MTKMDRIPAIDTIKYIAAVAVIIIHFAPEGTLGQVLQVISRFAVPYFFMVSGYFAVHKDKAAIGRTIQKLIRITAIASAFYLVYAINVEGLQKISSEFNVTNLLKLVVFNAPQIVSAHLWYMFAAICCYLIYLIFLKIKFTRLDFPIGLFLIMVHLILVEIFPFWGATVFRDNHPLVRNVWLMGFPFFLIGKYICLHKDKLHTPQMARVAYVCLATGLLAACLTGVYKFEFYLELYVSSVLISVSIFVLAELNPDFGRNTIFEKLGRNESIWVYLLHPMIGNILITQVANGRTSWIILDCIVIITTVCSTILSKAISKIRNICCTWR